MTSPDFKLNKFVDLNIWPEPHTHAIGQITLEWNQVEREFDRLVWIYLETDVQTARLITGLFGNRDKTELLSKLVTLKETEPTIAAAVEHAIGLFHICRENRNHIAHSIAQKADASHKISLRKPRKQNPLEDHELVLDINQIRECANDIRKTRNYIDALAKQTSLLLTARQLLLQSVGDDDADLDLPQIVLPPKPPKPHKLDSLLQIIPDSGQPQPQA